MDVDGRHTAVENRFLKSRKMRILAHLDGAAENSPLGNWNDLGLSIALRYCSCRRQTFPAGFSSRSVFPTMHCTSCGSNGFPVERFRSSQMILILCFRGCGLDLLFER